MKKVLCILIILVFAGLCLAQGSGIPPYVTQFWRDIVNKSDTETYGIDLSGGTWANAVMNWDTDPVIQANGTNLLRSDSTNFNIFFGDDVFGGLPGGITQAQNDGQYNAGYGYQAGHNNDSSGGGNEGLRCLYFGYRSGYGATGGTSNTGYNNVGLGRLTLYFNTSGNRCMAIGDLALYNNTIGKNLTAVGPQSLYSNVNGDSSIGIGTNAVYSNVSGDNLIGIGSSSLFNAIHSNTIGIGGVSGFSSTSAARCNYIGHASAYYNQTGDDLVIIGSYAGGFEAGGVNSFSKSTVVGNYGGCKMQTADSCIFLGYKAAYNQIDVDNLLIIDNQDRGSAAAEITNTLMYGVFHATPASQSLRLNLGNLYLGNPTHSNADGGGAIIQSFIREDGAGTASTSATITASHDGAGANDQLGKMTLGVNTGSGVVDIVTLNSSGIVKMEDDKLIAVDTNAGLTASITQTQGQGALTAQVNEISTVANDGDTVTLLSAVTGVRQEIINNGANTLLIFPASGDDLGLGVNVAEELMANESVGFVAYDTTNWAKESTTEIIHAEIHDEDNTDAFVVNDAGGDFHSYHTNGLVAGDLADWTFDAGGAGTSFPIASIADGADSGVDIEVTTTGNHLLEVGDIVSQTNLADVAYVGIFDVKAIISATQYEVAAVFTADGTGTMDQAATLEADAVAAGSYSFAYYISGTLVGNNETFDFQLYREATAVTGSKIRRKFGAANDFGSMSGGGVVTVANGDKISLALSNEDSAANIILRNVTIVLIRL